MTLRKERLERGKLSKFLLTIFLIVVLFVAGSFLFNSCSGVFGRSTDSVSYTEWVSWNYGSLRFENTVGYHVTENGNTFFRFEEQDGSIELIVEEHVYLIVTRFGSDKIVTSDGKNVFYYKGSWGLTEYE